MANTRGTCRLRPRRPHELGRTHTEKRTEPRLREYSSRDRLVFVGSRGSCRLLSAVITPFLVFVANGDHTCLSKQVARGIVCTHEIFVAGQKVHRQRWARACREVGEILRLLVGAMDEEKLQGKDVTRCVSRVYILWYTSPRQESTSVSLGFVPQLLPVKPTHPTRSLFVASRPNTRMDSVFVGCWAIKRVSILFVDFCVAASLAFPRRLSLPLTL